MDYLAKAAEIEWKALEAPSTAEGVRLLEVARRWRLKALAAELADDDPADSANPGDEILQASGSGKTFGR